MEWKELTKVECEDIFQNIDFENFHLADRDYRKVRFYLVDAYTKVLDEINSNIDSGKFNKSKKRYYIDCLFGIELYKILHKNKFYISNANNTDVWRYISLKIIPDIVYERYKDSGRLTDRFYAISNRIWLRTIWWYVHLSLQVKYVEGKKKIDYEKTKEMLISFDTDYIMQIVDRAGAEGYRVELNRRLVNMLYEYKSLSNSKNRFYRKVLILNTARLKVFDPVLYKDGIDGYVNDLFNDLINKR